MNSNRVMRNALAGLLIGTVGLASLVPAAEARGHYSDGGRIGGYRVVRYGYGPRYVEIHRGHSSALPAFAGFLGGLALGSVIGHSSARREYVVQRGNDCAPQQAEYYYYDPYCGERFSSLDSYGSHVCGHHHPRIVQVISVDTGRCVHVYHYYRGRWEDQDGDWDEDDE